jgi:hypothetical protein
MPRVGFVPMTPAFEQTRTVLALDRATGFIYCLAEIQSLNGLIEGTDYDEHNSHEVVRREAPKHMERVAFTFKGRQRHLSRHFLHLRWQ